MDAAADRQRLQDVAHLQGLRPARHALRGAGVAVYRQTVRCLYGRSFEAWCERRAGRRRFLPGDGREWQLLSATRGFTQAFH
eukprot:3083146-Alexandrium_andersonii.AAC.1